MADDINNNPQTPPEGNGGGKKRRRLRDRIRKPRFRFTFIWVVGFLVLLLSLATDPDTGLIREMPFGAGTLATLVIMVRAIWFLGLLHFARKGLMDYFDMEEAWEKCKNDPRAAGFYVIGAGLYTIAMGLVIIAAILK